MPRVGYSCDGSRRRFRRIGVCRFCGSSARHVAAGSAVPRFGDRARGRSSKRAHRCVGDRPHRRDRAPEDRRRHSSGFHRARRRRHRPPHRRARARGRHRLGDLRARQFQRRADRPPDRRAALSHGRLRPVLARPRHFARREHHAELGRPARAAGLGNRRHFPRHTRSRHRHHLCRGAAHRQPAADLFVGARRLQGQGQFVHALPRHRHRHRRPARAVPHHPVRGQGQRDVSGRRRARLGGAGLYRHRLRILGQGVRSRHQRRARLARIRRSHPRGDAAGVPVRLSQSQSLARALFAHHRRLARLPRHARRGRAVRSADRFRHRAHFAVPRRGRRICARRVSGDPRLRPRGAADPDLVPAGRLGDRRRLHGHRAA